MYIKWTAPLIVLWILFMTSQVGFAQVDKEGHKEGHKQGQKKESNQEQALNRASLIKAELSQMLQQTRDPFLIIEVVGSKKFVQFYNEAPGILFDLPEVSLSKEETERAATYFQTVGIPKHIEAARDPNTLQEFELVTWRAVFPPSQIDKVVEITLATLHGILHMSVQDELTFIRGWEYE